MKKSIFHPIISTAFLGLCMFAAVSCNSVKYTGDKLPAVPSDEPIIFITDVNSRSEKEQVLGYAEMDAGPTMKNNDIKNALKDKARDVGANVIRIVTMKKIPDGEARMDQRYNTSRSGLTWNVQETSDTAFTNLREGMSTAGENNSPGLISGWLSGSFGSTDDKTVYRTYVRAEFRALRDL